MGSTHSFTPSPTHTDEVGAGAVEVAAMLGDSVVGVKHCMNPRAGKVTMKTWGLFAAGAACLLTSGIAFATSVDIAASNKAALDYHTRVLKRPEFAYRPAPTPAGLPFLAFGGLALGLAGLTAGLVRLRDEKKSPYYRVGTAPGVEQPLDTAPSPSFPLVAPAGDDFVFNFGPGIDGEMTVGGQTTSLAELAASGRARPSATTAGAIEVPIPAHARIRATSGNTTFVVSAVAKPRRQPMPLFALENRTMGYVAGSLAVHLGVWAFLQTVPAENEGINVDLTAQEALAVRASTTDHDTVPPPEPDRDDDGSGDSQGMGAKLALDEGAAGKPTADSVDGHLRIKDNQREPALTRAQAIEDARNRGILGSTAALTSAIGTLASDADYSSGFDDANVYGPLFGADGEGRGVFGGGVHGFGPGGGCAMPPCGIIGTGDYGTIGTGDKAGDGWSGPGGGNGRLRKRAPFSPSGYLGRPISEGDLDKAIIKRYIKRQVDKIAYCYEKQLLANPGLGGTVNVQFLIAANGSVQSASGAGVSGDVSSCVASVIKNISFPAPRNGGTVQVNYPFNFHRAGN